MKHIVNGNLWKRLFAKIIDFLMVFGLSFLLFFTLIYPNTFDETKYTSNLDKIGEEYDRSQLFLKSSKGNYTSKGAFRAIVKIDDLKIEIKDNHIYVDINDRKMELVRR